MKNDKKRREDFKLHKKDSVGLFSGQYKKQVFKDKKDILEKENKKSVKIDISSKDLGLNN